VLCFVCLFKTNIEFISWWFFLAESAVYAVYNKGVHIQPAGVKPAR
jgi:hypothetical protein